MNYPDKRNCHSECHHDHHHKHHGCEPKEMLIPVTRDPCQRLTPVVIPHVKVKNFDEARAFPNHYVFVELTQQWCHIDEFGNVATLSNSYLFRNNFDAESKVGLYRSIQVFDFEKALVYIYNNLGQYMTFALTAPVIEDGTEESEA